MTQPDMPFRAEDFEVHDGRMGVKRTAFSEESASIANEKMREWARCSVLSAIQQDDRHMLKANSRGDFICANCGKPLIIIGVGS